MNFVDIPEDDEVKFIPKGKTYNEIKRFQYNQGVYQGIKWTIKMVSRGATHQEILSACRKILKFLEANDDIENIEVWRVMEKQLPKSYKNIELEDKE